MTPTQVLLPLHESVGREGVRKYRNMCKAIVAQVEKCGIENDKYGFDEFLDRLGITEKNTYSV